ncbi:MAG TPA: hypothetical protein VJT71_13770 [Pyrinomonadaceae bacterium]|nr:hypothetical protein [Pyrinomonadaceae bacterium]
MNSKHPIWRGSLAITSMVILAFASILLSQFVVRRFGPRNLLNTKEPAIAIPELLVAYLASVVFFGVVLLGAGVLWLLLMKPFFQRHELSTMFGLEKGKQNRAKKLVGRVINLIY